MKILLLGKDGQVGWELQRALAPLGELVAFGRQGRDGLSGDLSNPAALRATVDAVAPDVIVNAAAHTAVDKAESEAELAQRINADAPAVLAEAAASRGAVLVHYSTDYGEAAIRASGCTHLIFRTSWVYAARGGNFATTMLRLAADRERLTVIADQIGAPTGAELIADVSAHAVRSLRARPELSGTYHLAAAGETSWHGYASFVIEAARARGVALKVGEIAPIPTTDYPTPATRPLNSRLDTTRLSAAFGLSLPPWQDGVARMLDETL